MNGNPAPLATDAKSVAVRSIHAMANGDRTEFDAVIHPQAVDHENKVQPPASRVAGPAGFYATALWLRAAFANLHYDIHHVLADGDLVAVNSTMNGQFAVVMDGFDVGGAKESEFGAMHMCGNETADS